MNKRILGAVLTPLVALGIAACSVEQTEEGDLPDVDVQGGNLPEYDVDAADVRVGTDTQRVVVPDVDINAPGDDTPDTTANRQ